ncbi:MAG TPA: hypothetical protein VF597_01685 [Candidatus Saccharimonadales bacterium]|jgi:hypothetical protein
MSEQPMSFGGEAFNGARVAQQEAAEYLVHGPNGSSSAGERFDLGQEDSGLFDEAFYGAEAKHQAVQPTVEGLTKSHAEALTAASLDLTESQLTADMLAMGALVVRIRDLRLAA